MMKRIAPTAVLMSLCLAAAPAVAANKKDLGPRPTPPNELSKTEAAAGWKLLFDGKTTNGWRGFNSAALPAAGWGVSDGALKRMPKAAGGQAAGGGDIVTVDEYDNFELRIDWRILAGGNSGIKYLVDEAMVKTGHSGLGFELQILDDSTHPDAKLGKGGNRTTGALYDLIAPTKHVARPVGEWNHFRLLVSGNHIEHWLNGDKVVEYERASPAMKALIAGSKYKTIPGFGEVKKGRILLQDHGDEVWFRNIKLRSLAPASPAVAPAK